METVELKMADYRQTGWARLLVVLAAVLAIAPGALVLSSCPGAGAAASARAAAVPPAGAFRSMMNHAMPMHGHTGHTPRKCGMDDVPTPWALADSLRLHREHLAGPLAFGLLPAALVVRPAARVSRLRPISDALAPLSLHSDPHLGRAPPRA